MFYLCKRRKLTDFVSHIIPSVADLCLKYYRASRYRVVYVMIVFIELSALVAQINDLHFWKTTYIYKDLMELHMRDVCVSTEYFTHCPCSDRTANILTLRVQNCECVACTGTGAANAYTKRDIENQFPGT